jgi:hypothetical protein
MRTQAQLDRAQYDKQQKDIRNGYSAKTKLPVVVIEAMQIACVIPNRLESAEDPGSKEIVDFLCRYKKVFKSLDVIRCGVASLELNERYSLLDRKVDGFENGVYLMYYRFYIQNLYNSQVQGVTAEINQQAKRDSNIVIDSDFRIKIDRIRRTAKKQAARDREKKIGGVV